MATWGSKGEYAIFMTYLTFVKTGSEEKALEMLRRTYPMWIKPGAIENLTMAVESGIQKG